MRYTALLAYRTWGRIPNSPSYARPIRPPEPRPPGRFGLPKIETPPTPKIETPAEINNFETNSKEEVITYLEEKTKVQIMSKFLTTKISFLFHKFS